MILNFNVPVLNEEVYDSISEIRSGFSHYANDCVHFRKNHRSLFLIGVYKLAKSDKAYCFHDHCTNKFSCSPSFLFI